MHFWTSNAVVLDNYLAAHVHLIQHCFKVLKNCYANALMHTYMTQLTARLNHPIRRAITLFQTTDVLVITAEHTDDWAAAKQSISRSQPLHKQTSCSGMRGQTSADVDARLATDTQHGQIALTMSMQNYWTDINDRWLSTRSSRTMVTMHATSCMYKCIPACDASECMYECMFIPCNTIVIW